MVRALTWYYCDILNSVTVELNDFSEENEYHLLPIIISRVLNTNLKRALGGGSTIHCMKQEFNALNI